MKNTSKIIRNGAIIAGGIVLLFAAAVVVLLVQNQPKSYSATLAQVRAQAPSTPVACIATMDNITLRVPSLEQSAIFDAVSSSIIDIPAGTKISVNIDSYDGSKAGGTIVYDGNYGSYNFVANKGSSSSKWLVEPFVMCR